MTLPANVKLPKGVGALKKMANNPKITTGTPDQLKTARLPKGFAALRKMKTNATQPTGANPALANKQAMIDKFKAKAANHPALANKQAMLDKFKAKQTARQAANKTRSTTNNPWKSWGNKNPTGTSGAPTAPGSVAKWRNKNKSWGNRTGAPTPSAAVPHRRKGIM